MSKEWHRAECGRAESCGKIGVGVCGDRRRGEKTRNQKHEVSDAARSGGVHDMHANSPDMLRMLELTSIRPRLFCKHGEEVQCQKASQAQRAMPPPCGPRKTYTWSTVKLTASYMKRMLARLRILHVRTRLCMISALDRRHTTHPSLLIFGGGVTTRGVLGGKRRLDREEDARPHVSSTSTWNERAAPRSMTAAHLARSLRSREPELLRLLEGRRGQETGRKASFCGKSGGGGGTGGKLARVDGQNTEE